MANRGTITNKFYFSSPGGGYFHHSASLENPLFTGIFEWEAHQDVVNNTSTISWKVTMDCSKTANYNSKLAYLKLNNTSYASKGFVTVRHHEWSMDTVGNTESATTVNYDNIPAGTSAEIASGSFTVDHKSDGTRTLYNILVNIGGIEGYDSSGTKILYSSSNNWAQMGPYAGEDDINIVLEQISTHAIVTSVPESFTDESSPTMYYGIPKKATKAEVGIAFGNSSTVSIPYRTVSLTSTSYTFNFDASEKSIIWNLLKQGIDTTAVRFYIRSTVDSIPYIEYLPSTLEIINYRPIFNSNVQTVYDSNTDVVDRLTGNKYILVRYVSDAYWVSGAQARKGATINTQSVKVGGKTYYGASGTVEDITDNKFLFTVVDDAGRSEQSEYNIPDSNWIKYIKLTCSSTLTEMTGDGDVRVTLKGKYFDGHFGKKANTLRMNYDISKNNEDFVHVDKGYIYPTVDDDGNYTYSFTISDLDYMSIYELTIRVSDEVSVEPTEAHTVIASEPIFDWSRTDFNFNVPVNINGDLTVEGTIKAGGKTVPTIQAQGTAGIWTYRTWSDGTAECWGKKDFTVNVTSAWGNMYTSGAISGSNVSFPFGLFAETPIVNASLLVRSAGGILMAPGGAGSNIASMDQTGVYEIARGTSLSNAAYTINYQVIGRWK